MEYVNSLEILSMCSEIIKIAHLSHLQSHSWLIDGIIIYLNPPPFMTARELNCWVYEEYKKQYFPDLLRSSLNLNFDRVQIVQLLY